MAMIPINITDNQKLISIKKCASKLLSDDELCIVKSDLKKIADINIENLSLDDKPNLLIFPRDLKQYGDGIRKKNILSLSDDQISTNNIMGFVGVNDTQLDIKSRFAQDGGRDYFLHYMLQKVFAINLFDIPHTSNQEQIFDFLLYLFPYYLNKALAQGLFKKYRSFDRNDANIRGTIDVSRHIRQNIPFRGTVAYTVRTHSYDNEITQLIRHTIEYIKTKPYGSSILNNDAETKRSVAEIVSATQTYKQQDRAKIIGENLRPVRHPYFAAYTDLQKICLQILRHETIKYGQEKDKVYGILFDGAWLWEEYLAGVLKNYGYTHAENNTRKNPITLYNGNLRYPDFYKSKQIKEFRYGYPIPEENDVLDAKYKMLDSNSVDRNDIHQIVTYMHILPSKRCGLVFPSKYTTSAKSSFNVYGMGGTIRIFGLQVYHDSNDDHSDFDFISYAKKMEQLENKLVNILNT